LPGDLSPDRLLDRILRVDQAGEYGAVRIYEGQLAALKGAPAEAPIAGMAEAERAHLEAFDRLLVERGARPTAHQPLWRVAGFALGAGTALLGPRAAMACTVAVEEVIERHYQRQIEALGAAEPELRATLDRFRDDEAAHHAEALSHEAEQAPLYRPLTAAVRAGTRLAIWLSERI
jgi:ubiquinone biosynthesis monooxygenase Coq7